MKNESKIYHADGVCVKKYENGRIKVKLPRQKFEQLRDLYGGHDMTGIEAFLKKQGFKSTRGLKSCIELGTGHICYIYRPKAKPKAKKKKGKEGKDDVRPAIPRKVAEKTI